MDDISRGLDVINLKKTDVIMGFRERSNPKVMREVEVNCTRTGLNYLTT